MIGILARAYVDPAQLDSFQKVYTCTGMLALLLLSNFSLHGTVGVRGWFDVALR
jgi:hypothetical protein